MRDVHLFPWDAVMTYALGVLHWTPAALWAATPREVAAAMRLHAGAKNPAPDAAALRALMRDFPDTDKQEAHHG